MQAFYKSLGGIKLTEITGCKNEKDCETGMHTNRLPSKLQIYVMSSCIACCGGNTKDWVSETIISYISRS